MYSSVALNRKVAVFIDAENAQFHTVSQSQLLQFVSYFGSIEHCKAYGNWTQRQACKKEYIAASIDCIDVPHTYKDATDDYIKMQASAVFSNGNNSTPQQQVVVIVSGDGGFATACNYLREHGVFVVVIGNRALTTEELISSCDMLFYLEDLPEHLEELAQRWPFSPDLISTFMAMVDKAYLSLAPTPYEAWVSLSALGSKLREIDPDYQSSIKQQRLSQWLGFSPYYEVREQEVRRIKPNDVRRKMLLHQAYLQLAKEQPDGSVQLGQLAQLLHQTVEDYKELFGTKKISTWLAQEPDRYKVNGQHVISPNPDVRRKMLLHQAYLQLAKEQPDGSVQLGQLAQLLRQTVEDYKELFGTKKISTWLAQEPDRYKVNGQHVISPNPDVRRKMLLHQAYLQLAKEHPDGSVPLGGLAQLLRQTVEDYEELFGTKKISTWLAEEPDRYKVNGQHVISPNPDVRRKMLLHSAYLQLAKEHPDGSVHLGQLGQLLRQTVKDYKELFGTKKISTWLAQEPDRYKVNGQRVISRD